ncbi:hypothetical protein QYM36_001265 [Artemia franciscana]|uniref:PiggyBac transposable element-derived protein domain-containing protein n=1 Tax=Artemia franciscana TaxID=6661 RepID=A0AA88IA43_ARTSF|nr:hypothetical protein QYM36_001265 [Artemia franciscana]
MTTGRSFVRQYLSNKPHKWGFKVFTRAGNSGIMYDIEIYKGRETVEARSLGLVGDAFMRLLRSLKHTRHKIFFNNWFSIVDLVVHLKEIGYDCAGTVCQNRLSGCQLMEEKELKRFDQGHVDWRVEKSTEVCLVRWYDNKAVTLVSNYVAVEPKDTCRRWGSSEKDRNRKDCERKVEIERTAVIKEYKYMSGVDLADMLIELYRSNLKTRKWYMRIFYYFLDSAVVNGWLIYRRHCWLIYRRHCWQSNEKPMPLLKFKTSIACSLGYSDTSRRRPGRPLSLEAEDVRHDGYNNFPEFGKDQKRCRICQRKTKILCSKCLGIALCLVPERNCFLSYHRR